MSALDMWRMSRWKCPKDGAPLNPRPDDIWWTCQACGLDWAVPTHALAHDGGVDAAVERGSSDDCITRGPYR